MLKKGLKRDILIFLAFAYEEVVNHNLRMRLASYMMPEGIKLSSFGSAVSRLLSVGEIEKFEKNGQVYLRLTSQGSERLKQSVPIFRLANKRWDGYWRIVIFDFPEKERFKRDTIRNKLTDLGFGKWQRSVYISPHDFDQEINQYLKAKKLFPECVCLVARKTGFGDDKDLAYKVWQLNNLNEDYEEFIFECEELREKAKEVQVKREEVNDLWEQFKELLFRDPYLPKKLLSEYWLREKARKAFVNTLESLPKGPTIVGRNGKT